MPPAPNVWSSWRIFGGHAGYTSSTGRYLVRGAEVEDDIHPEDQVDNYLQDQHATLGVVLKPKPVRDDNGAVHDAQT